MAAPELPCSPPRPTAHGPTLVGERDGGRRTTAPAPRPVLQGRLGGLGPPLQPGNDQGPARPASPTPSLLPCVGLGVGRREGVGANGPSGGSGSRASNSRGKKIFSRRRFSPKRKNSLSSEGEGRNAGRRKEEKTRQMRYREIQKIASRFLGHVIRGAFCVASGGRSGRGQAERKWRR